MTDERKLRTAALRRRVGMDPAARDRMNAAFRAGALTTTCAICNKRLTGTYEELKRHAADHASET